MCQSIQAVRQHHLKQQNPIVYEDMYVLIYAKIHEEYPEEFLIYPKYWKDEINIAGCVLPIDELGEPIFLTFHQTDSFINGVIKLMMKGGRKKYNTSLSNFENNSLYGVKES